MNPTKVCSTCKTDKPYTSYEPDSRYKSGLRSQCATCRRTMLQESRLRYTLNRLYGITLEEYMDMEVQQNKLCAICKNPETRSTRSSKRAWETDIKPRLVVDHDHISGKVRGLLCHKCNVGMGQLQDSVDLLKSAIKYLETYQ